MSARPSRPPARTDSLDRYLHEISAYPLIDREEEARLARGIRAGEVEALEKLVRSNLRFVVSIAKRYQNQGVALADLINEGNLGLVRAAYRFDESKGIKFISYAVWWIRQAIFQALAEQSRIVRLPPTRAGEMHRIGKETAALSQKLGREPTVKEIAAASGADESEVLSALSLSRRPLSLDATVRQDDESRLSEYLADEDATSADDEAMDAARDRSVHAALDVLDDREAAIVRLYFGLGEEEPLTLEEIGTRFGVTRERVRQIKERALRRLRNHSQTRQLESYVQ
jgi:RNA polymerase primary sigma factor